MVGSLFLVADFSYTDENVHVGTVLVSPGAHEGWATFGGLHVLLVQCDADYTMLLL